MLSFSPAQTSRYSSTTAMLIFPVSTAQLCISVQSSSPWGWTVMPETYARDESISSDHASPLACGFALRRAIQAAEGFNADTEEQRGNQFLACFELALCQDVEPPAVGPIQQLPGMRQFQFELRFL